VGSRPHDAALADPVTWLATADEVPPFSIAHGDADCIVPVQQSELLAGALADAGVPHQLVLRPGWVHVDPRFDGELLEPTIAWLHRVLA